MLEHGTAVIGLGYVGLPLAVGLARAGNRVIGFDVDPAVIATLESGASHIQDITDVELGEAIAAGLSFTSSVPDLQGLGAYVICVPTPLASSGSPDLSYVEMAAAAVAGQLGRPQPFKPEDKIRVRLVPNPLFQEAMQDLDVQIGIDTKGAFLRAPDGLPIRTLTETPVLKWAVMGREGGKAVTVFQSDGALVEEFKVLKIANTMAFDAGDYEWAGK